MQNILVVSQEGLSQGWLKTRALHPPSPPDDAGGTKGECPMGAPINKSGFANTVLAFYQAAGLAVSRGAVGLVMYCGARL
ncbi:hypothetical protein [Okeania sp. SIO2B3]|uniref:hypothetical protein n=1 Tax=Okeania sp. SIO2B3 TaxID=2607784 RepID=UPI0013C18ADA|nr:hypothetical protein [Okeania sp. SIO2B3]NET42104.1 hypothetical protein [Okeania sp. SIO2B3]